MTTFEDIVHDEFILKAIADLGFTKPTAIQEACIPVGLEQKDIIGQAKTGSGKTFAFGIPILHSLEVGHGIRSVILAPTRELCQQIARELEKLAKYTRAKVTMVYGGVAIDPQISDLKRADIVVATPGRLLDHMERNTIHIDKVKTFVLDEADRMLDMGFIEDIQRIIAGLPRDKQMWLFSATMPIEIKELASHYLQNPEHIKTSAHVTGEYLPQYYYVVEHNKKFSLLHHIISEDKPERAIVFCGTRRTAEAVARNLKRQRIKADELHGGMSQAKRDRVLKEFHEGKVHLLIATDVAARGLDIQDVTHVINYDVPRNPEDYTHRIGRTARAGKSGKALTLLQERDFEFFQGILNIVPKEPEKLDVGNIRSVGFRKHEDGDRGGYNRGPPRSGYGRGPPRSSGPSSPRTSARTKKKESKGGWKQSMRR